VTEEIAKHWAASLNVAPVQAWDIRKYMEKIKSALACNIDDHE
jgi:hypothetical protein